MWEEVHPYLNFEAPQRRGVLHNSENGFPLQFGVEVMSNFGASKGNNGGGERKKKTNVEGEEKILNFCWRKRENFGFYFSKKDFLFLFSKSNATCLILSGAKGAHLFPLMWLHTQPQGEKNLTFWMLKSRLGLRAASLVPVPRVSLHPSGPVFESRQYLYQNAQNETLSVVQRLVLLNF